MESTASEPLVTVVIPTYNRSAVVGAAIASVLAQEDVSLELVVVDDGSTDDTVQQVGAHRDPRVRVVAADHAGVSGARNRGAAAARGTWLTFLDSDDVASPGWLAALLAATDGTTPFVSCAATLRYPDGVAETPGPVPLGPAFGSITALFLAGTFLLRKELFHSVGGYLDGLAYGENSELGMRLGVEIERRSVVAGVVPAPYVEIAAARRSYDAARSYGSGVAILEHSGSILARDPHLFATYLGITGVAAARCGRTGEARRLLLRAWRREPLSLRHPARLLRSQLPIKRLR